MAPPTRSRHPGSASSLVEEFYFGTQGPSPVNTTAASGPVVARPEIRENVPLSYQQEVALTEKDQFRECVGCPEMVVMPEGEYMMGSQEWRAGSLQYGRPATPREDFAALCRRQAQGDARGVREIHRRDRLLHRRQMLHLGGERSEGAPWALLPQPWLRSGRQASGGLHQLG